jgi:regulator of protease activity HflC (stomatin/prohibitin superfamily)
MQEKELRLMSGWPMLAVALLTPFVLAALFMTANPIAIVLAMLLGVGWLISLFGFIVVNPNESRVVQLFGTYVGTVKETGFFYGNPFYGKRKVSLRVHTFETGVMDSPAKKDAAGNVIEAGHRTRQPSKVNDLDGTPIEIAAVVTWRVVNTAEAVFQVDNYEEFIHIQSEAALRSLASQYHYDDPNDQAHSLRGNTTEVADRLQHEIAERVKQAGLEILEARISVLAYAPEIAAAMLQRQQAAAIIAARQKIVEGAVGMVEHALEMLNEKQVLQLDEERKAAMVSNLLVVLCGHSNPQPVLNTGTIYQ